MGDYLGEQHPEERGEKKRILRDKEDVAYTHMKTV
jgi:hypothetical protein